ncbi:MAG: hypothetical protein J4452_00790 [Candidatus Aenigmarchaeota archaeon]|nr:hypothetical protein [Candidatus Aenigmarchaeota archaeon]
MHWVRHKDMTFEIKYFVSMGIKSGLEKLSEIATLLYFIETTPLTQRISKRRQEVINKYRHFLINNFYFKRIVEPLVLRLHEHASQSPHVTRYICAYKRGTTFAFTIRGRPVYPVLTMGSEEQLYEICEKECVICPAAVYTPAFFIGLIQLAMFESARHIYKTADKIRTRIM